LEAANDIGLVHSEVVKQGSGEGGLVALVTDQDYLSMMSVAHYPMWRCGVESPLEDVTINGDCPRDIPVACSLLHWSYVDEQGAGGCAF
jgi:hypothetical protein